MGSSAAAPWREPPPHAVHVLQDGSRFLAGCSDGVVRLYGPQSGQLRRVLAGAHQAAVTAVAVAGDGQRLYSGDASGVFKAWHLGSQSHSMLAALKEHKVSDCVGPLGKDRLVFPKLYRVSLHSNQSLQTPNLPSIGIPYHMYESFGAFSGNVNMVG